jgi:hypothetical protein
MQICVEEIATLLQTKITAKAMSGLQYVRQYGLELSISLALLLPIVYYFLIFICIRRTLKIIINPIETNAYFKE